MRSEGHCVPNVKLRNGNELTNCEAYNASQTRNFPFAIFNLQFEATLALLL